MSLAPTSRRTLAVWPRAWRKLYPGGHYWRFPATPSTLREFLAVHDAGTDPEIPFHDVESHMLDRNPRVVPILAEGKPIAAITRTDLLRILHDDVLAGASQG